MVKALEAINSRWSVTPASLTVNLSRQRVSAQLNTACYFIVRLDLGFVQCFLFDSTFNFLVKIMISLGCLTLTISEMLI